MLLIRHANIMFGQGKRDTERMWALVVALKQSSCFPRGCEVGGAHWLIRWWRMSLSRGRWSERTPAVFPNTCWLTDLPLTVFCLRLQGFEQCDWVCTASSQRSPGRCQHQKGERLCWPLAETNTHLSAAAKSSDTQQLLVLEELPANVAQYYRFVIVSRTESEMNQWVEMRTWWKADDF